MTRSMRALTQTQENLDSGVPGTAWSIDVVSNQVLVEADSTVSAGALGQIEAAVAKANGAARLAKVEGTFQPTITGGDAIYGGGYRCSLGFNVRSGSTYYFLTAGHCGKVANDSTTGTKSGTVTGLNATVHYSGGGTVKGMIRTNVCAEPGDSGGPLYDGSIALGLTSGGNGNCSSGGTTYFQPVTEALSKYHVSVF